MRRVVFTVEYPPERAHPLHRQLMSGGPVSRLELLNWGPTAAVTSLVWYDAERAVVAALLEEFEAIETATLVEADGGTYALTTQSSFELDPAVMAIVEAARVAFVPPITFADDGASQFAAVGEQTALSELHDALAGELPTRIERVEDFSRKSTPAGLTDRQRAALEAAVAVGYYEIPRTASVADVATELDCTDSTAGELLRKAERAVLTGFVEGRGGPADRGRNGWQ